MVRPPAPAEAEALTALVLRSKAHWGYSAEFMAACRDELAVTPEGLQSKHLSYRLLEREGELVGFYCLHSMGAGQFELDALFVEPAHIGTGAGRALFDHAVGQVAGLGGGSLLIQSDPFAADFYRSVGATQTGVRASGSIAGRELPLFELAIAG